MRFNDRLDLPATSTSSRRSSAFQPPQPEAKRTNAPTSRGGAAFDFANFPVSPTRTRATKAPCSCGATCAKCSSRNPDGASGERSTRDGQGTTQDAGPAAPAPAVVPAAAPAAAPAAPARRAALQSGPRYTPNGAIAPTTVGGLKSAGPFVFDAVFQHDPANGIHASCGEIHQDIKWNVAAATSFTALFGSSVPHSGFPSSAPANVWIEDRDSANTRYGRRSGAMSAPGPGDQYTDSTGAQNQRSGATYHGSDNPSNWPAALTGRWTFMVLAFDMCNRGVQVGSADFITIDW
jgi:hypothetical protein